MSFEVIKAKCEKQNDHTANQHQISKSIEAVLSAEGIKNILGRPQHSQYSNYPDDSTHTKGLYCRYGRNQINPIAFEVFPFVT